MSEIPSRAQEILDNPVYGQVLDGLRKKYYELWREAEPKSAQREYWGMAHDMIDDLDLQIRAHMGNDELDIFQQKRREA